jgi:hypothetical protein
MTQVSAINVIQLGAYQESVISQAIRGDTMALIQAAAKKGKSGMNSAHVLNVFSKFEDQDWDRALVIWWQALMVFCFFGGAISAAVWA